MRCQFCHNPDTWKLDGGTEYTADALLEKRCVLNLLGNGRRYYGQRRGAIAADRLLLELFQKAKQQGVHTVIDTAGNPFTREGEFSGNSRR